MAAPDSDGAAGDARIGRPPREDRPEVEAAFLAAILDGATTTKACEKADVSWGSVSRWLTDDADFAARHARAREAAGHMWADKAVDVLEALPEDPSKEQVAAARAKADIYKWRAVVQGRRDYSEKSAVDLTSGGKPLAAAQVVVIGGQEVRF